MMLADLVNHATDKERFHSVGQYVDFCARYLEYVETGLQARIVSQNESHYQFFQYRQEGSFNITRPLNSRCHFKAYTVKLNPLDGVYYCDIRPNMREDALLSQHIKTIDHFFYSDLWALLAKHGQSLEGIAIDPQKNGDVA